MNTHLYLGSDLATCARSGCSPRKGESFLVVLLTWGTRPGFLTVQTGSRFRKRRTSRYIRTVKPEQLYQLLKWRVS